MQKYEVIIIGGSYAGLSAAMALGRASRSVLIIDNGKPCNRQTPYSHNFLTQDGETPAAISAKAKEQVLKYPTVTFIDGRVTEVTKTEGGFTIAIEDGSIYHSAKILLAAGIKDSMPDIDGFAECWGISVIHCPYCHGYEVKGLKTAVFANGDAAMHYAQLLRQWTNDLTFFTNGPAEFTAEQQSKLQKHNITNIETRVESLKHTDGKLEEISLADGSRHSFTVLYARPAFTQNTNIHEQIGCATDEHGYITVDDMLRTTVAGVYAAGDCSTMMRSVANAVATGNKAGAIINMELCSADF